MHRCSLLSLVAAAGLAACQPAGTPPTGPEAGDAAAASPAAPEVAATASSGVETASASPSSAAPSPTGTPPAPDADGPAQPGDCGADKVAARWLNALPTADVKAAIAKAVGERSIRYYGEGDAITMDFSPQRLNVELGKDGRIKLFRCG